MQRKNHPWYPYDSFTGMCTAAILPHETLSTFNMWYDMIHHPLFDKKDLLRYEYVLFLHAYAHASDACLLLLLN
jgi:hypothetical protein